MPLPTAPASVAPAPVASFFDDIESTAADHETRVDTLEAATTALDDLTDVDLATTPPTDGQALVFDDASGLWLPGTVAGGGGAIRVEDEGVSTVAAATGINFAGAGVTVTDAGSNEALVTISGDSGATFKQTVYTGTTNPTRNTSSFGDIDATLFPALSLTLAVGDVVDLWLQATFKNTASGAVLGFDWLIDQPTSADTTIRANGSKAAAWLYEWSTNGLDAQTLTPRGTFVATEAGVHTFKPQWRPFGQTVTMMNTDANYFTAAVHRVTNLGAAS